MNANKSTWRELLPIEAFGGDLDAQCQALADAIDAEVYAELYGLAGKPLELGQEVKKP